MSAGEDQSLAAFWQACPDADREERKWLEGSRVTLEDLERGSERIQRCTSADWWKRAASQSTAEPAPAARGAAPRSGAAKGGGGKSRPAGPLLWPFRDGKGRLAVEIREENPGFWRWSLQNVSWWRAKVAAAGLLDDEDDAA